MAAAQAGGRVVRNRGRLLGHNRLRLHDEREGFESEFGRQDRFGDEIVAAAPADSGAMLDIRRAGDEQNRRLLVVRQGPQLRT